MRKLKVLIVDDEPLAHKVLEKYCKSIEYVKVIGNCYDGISTINFLHRNEVDAILLDIQMPDISGLELLDTLQDKAPKVILTTAFSDFALDSFDYDQVVDFLHKPIRLNRFVKALERLKKIIDLEENVQNKGSDLSSNSEAEVPDFISLKDSKTIFRVPLNEILYIQSWGNYLKFFIKSGEVKIVRQTIKMMEEELSTKQFQRVHKSYIVNLRHVDGIEGNQVLIGQEKIAMGKSYVIQARKSITGK